jgi:hypothetical protein
VTTCDEELEVEVLVFGKGDTKGEGETLALLEEGFALSQSSQTERASSLLNVHEEQDQGMIVN